MRKHFERVSAESLILPQGGAAERGGRKALRLPRMEDAGAYLRMASAKERASRDQVPLHRAPQRPLQDRGGTRPFLPTVSRVCLRVRHHEGGSGGNGKFYPKESLSVRAFQFERGQHDSRMLGGGTLAEERCLCGEERGAESRRETFRHQRRGGGENRGTWKRTLP